MDKEIQFSCDSGHPPEIVRMEFTEREAVVLSLFRDDVNSLAESAPARRGVPCSLTIDADVHAGVSISSEKPTDDDIAILLHRMRPFLLHKESVSFNNTRAILDRRVNHACPRAVLRDLRRLWVGERLFESMQIRMNSKRINTDRLLSDWLNARQYHRDPEKAQAILELEQVMSPTIVEFLIFSLALEKYRVVRLLGSLVRFIADDVKELKLEHGWMRRLAGP